MGALQIGSLILALEGAGNLVMDRVASICHIHQVQVAIFVLLSSIRLAVLVQGARESAQDEEGSCVKFGRDTHRGLGCVIPGGGQLNIATMVNDGIGVEFDLGRR